MRNLFPDLYLDSVYDIDYNSLAAAGITNLIYDIDNTLAPFDTPEPFPHTLELFAALRGQGFAIALLSNNKLARVEGFAAALAHLGISYVAKAGKPGRRGLDAAMGAMGASRGNTVLIGDQVFTDVWCARRNGVYSILVKPVSRRDEPAVKLKRLPEKLVLYLYTKL
ncbi:MAG: YqeG family HAD IIIA-type phosphatase [Defluviitaleaceae bacterium]|nr:YqeG family HAD IIIA-type phosphatase [Defluviitaleaceae bacterium]